VLPREYENSHYKNFTHTNVYNEAHMSACLVIGTQTRSPEITSEQKLARAYENGNKTT
jgi:hypothetical protein